MGAKNDHRLATDVEVNDFSYISASGIGSITQVTVVMRTVLLVQVTECRCHIAIWNIQDISNEGIPGRTGR